MCEIAGRTRVVLRNGDETEVTAAMLLEDPFEKRQGELADRAGDFEECEYDGAAL